MNGWDIALLIILAFFVYRGIKNGFVASVGSIIGIVLGAWAAGRYYDEGAQLLIERFGLTLMMGIVVAFIVLYVLVNILVSIAVKLITKIFRIIPLATLTNRFIGGVLGLLFGALIFGLIIWIINLFPFETTFTRSLEESRVASYFEKSTALVQPLLPQSLRDIDFETLQSLQDLADDKADFLEQTVPDWLEKLNTEELKSKLDEFASEAEGLMETEEAEAMSDEEEDASMSSESHMTEDGVEVITITE